MPLHYTLFFSVSKIGFYEAMYSPSRLIKSADKASAPPPSEYRPPLYSFSELQDTIFSAKTDVIVEMTEDPYHDVGTHP